MGFLNLLLGIRNKGFVALIVWWFLILLGLSRKEIKVGLVENANILLIGAVRSLAFLLNTVVMVIPPFHVLHSLSVSDLS